jgi:hypothetical protein
MRPGGDAPIDLSISLHIELTCTTFWWQIASVYSTLYNYDNDFNLQHRETMAVTVFSPKRHHCAEIDYERDHRFQANQQ